MAKLNDTLITGSLNVSGPIFSQNGQVIGGETLKKIFGNTGCSYTVLYNAGGGAGPLTLTSAATNFDMLVVIVAPDANTSNTLMWAPLWMLKETAACGDIALVNGSYYWSITSASLSSTTWTTGGMSENAIMKKVIGIKFNSTTLGG